MYHRSHHYNKQRGEIDHEPIVTSTMSAMPTLTAITVLPVQSDTYSRKIEMSRIEKVEKPCDCEVKHCPQKCLSTLVSGTTTELTTTTTEETTFSVLSTTSTSNRLPQENTKESQLLVNSYPSIFQFSTFILLITLIFQLFN
uniref:Uncharacterized protein n=1 Tax=Caenorhabditis tropicalis TaxID=1561998 RepID=A0A1I7TAZ0_9PELO